MLVAGSKSGLAAEMIYSIFSRCVVAVALSCLNLAMFLSANASCKVKENGVIVADLAAFT